MLVDIIIPTFNRAGLLSTTIPSYIQLGVKNVFLIDDCSNDNTPQIAAAMCLAYPKLVYRRLPKKGRQMGAKNLGLSLCDAPYVYFGDDDSVLKPGSIGALLHEAHHYPGSIIAARHIYMKCSETVDNVITNSGEEAVNGEQIFDPSTMKLDLRYLVPPELSLPFCQACFLVAGDIARSKRFDEGYVGTCFREETDYIVSLRKLGAGLRVCNEALQINLPRSVAAGGGTSSVSSTFRHISEALNEFRFFYKHGDYLEDYVCFSCSPITRMVTHLWRKLKNYYLLLIKRAYTSRQSRFGQ